MKEWLSSFVVLQHDANICSLFSKILYLLDGNASIGYHQMLFKGNFIVSISRKIHILLCMQWTLRVE